MKAAPILIFAGLAVAMSAAALLKDFIVDDSDDRPESELVSESEDKSADLAVFDRRLAKIEQRLDEMARGENITRTDALLGDRLDLIEAKINQWADGASDEGTPSEAASSLRGASLDSDAIKSRVDEEVGKAVERELNSLKVRNNKKPPLDDVVGELKLSDAQRLQIEQSVVQGQREVRALLEIPTADGRNLMDDLVEAYAIGSIPGREAEAKKLWGDWYGRVMSEQIPGSETTYGERYGSIKESTHNSFERILDERQFKGYEEWEMDPLDIEDVPGSPWADVEERVRQRVEELGGDK